jgi:hypothetical protein
MSAKYNRFIEMAARTLRAGDDAVVPLREAMKLQLSGDELLRLMQVRADVCEALYETGLPSAEANRLANSALKTLQG